MLNAVQPELIFHQQIQFDFINKTNIAACIKLLHFITTEIDKKCYVFSAFFQI